MGNKNRSSSPSCTIMQMSWICVRTVLLKILFVIFRVCACPNRNGGISQCALQIACKSENPNTYEKLLLWVIYCGHRCSG